MAVTAVLAAGAARATQIYTNTGTGNYLNEAGQVMLTVTATAIFTGQGNPVLAIVKTSLPVVGPPGTIVTWKIKVTYPKIVDTANVCGDDSLAKLVVIKDAVPAGFTYLPGSLYWSVNNETAYVLLTDIADADAGDWNVTTAGAVTVNLGDLPEGTGDATAPCNSAATARWVRFQATKN